MLAELIIELNTEETIGYNNASVFQGVLMQHIDRQYAQKMHELKLNPYSQTVVNEEGKIEWCIRTLTEEAYNNIIIPLMADDFTEIYLEKKKIRISILDKSVTIKRKEELFEKFYNTADTNHYFNLEFQTPTSFKVNGEYCIMPDVRLIFQSLMNKYSAASDSVDMYDEETLEQLVSNSRIVSYKLKNAFFHLEGVRINGFRGNISIKVMGNDTMARYARMLVEFGEYSGIGIKTSMGMGSFRLR